MEKSIKAKLIIFAARQLASAVSRVPHGSLCSHKQRQVGRQKWICALTKMHQTVPITCYFPICRFHLSMDITGQYKCNSFPSSLFMNMYANVTFYINYINQIHMTLRKFAYGLQLFFFLAFLPSFPCSMFYPPHVATC